MEKVFIFPSGGSKPVCHICSENVVWIKSGNTKHPSETTHSSFEQSHSLKSKLRANKITELQAYDRYIQLITHTITAQQRPNDCSLKVLWILGQYKKKKRWSDGMVVKECLHAVVETLFEEKKSNKSQCQPNSNQKIRNISKWCTGTCSLMQLFTVHPAYLWSLTSLQILMPNFWCTVHQSFHKDTISLSVGLQFFFRLQPL